jgi:hypothetical protein
VIALHTHFHVEHICSSTRKHKLVPSSSPHVAACAQSLIAHTNIRSSLSTLQRTRHLSLSLSLSQTRKQNTNTNTGSCHPPPPPSRRHLSRSGAHAGSTARDWRQAKCDGQRLRGLCTRTKCTPRQVLVMQRTRVLVALIAATNKATAQDTHRARSLRGGLPTITSSTRLARRLRRRNCTKSGVIITWWTRMCGPSARLRLLQEAFAELVMLHGMFGASRL